MPASCIVHANLRALRSGFHLLPVAIGLAACALFLAAELSRGGGLGWPLDDAWIHAEFARHLAAGDGLAYEAGRRVAGSTAPLWTALLSLGFLLQLDPLVWGKFLGAMFFLAGVVAAGSLARALGLGPGLSTLAASLVAASGWLVWGAMSGLEIPLFTLLSLVGIERHLVERGGERTPLSLPLLGLAATARPEGLLLLALALFDGAFAARSAGARRALAAGLAVAILPILAVGLAYTAIGGSPWPTTLAAKTGGIARLLPDGRSLYAAFGVFFRTQTLLTLVAGAGALRLAARLGTPESRGLLPALWLFGLPVAQSLFEAPAGPLVGNFGRYLFPLLPLVVVLGILGSEGLAQRLRQLASPMRRRLAAAVLVALLLPALADLARVAGRFAQSVENVRASDVAMAAWLAPRLPAAAVLAVHDVGALGYLLPNPLIDLAGILEPGARQAMAAAEASGRGWQEGLLGFLERRRPDYLVVFPKFVPFLARPELSFRLVHEIEIEDNITMGDDRVALYETPWNRHPLSEAAGR